MASSAVDFAELVPGLPQELGLECLTRLHYSAYPTASGVCHAWRGLLRSREFYLHRVRSGCARKVACLVQALPGAVLSDGQKLGGSPTYGITLFDPAGGSWERVDPVPDYPNGLPLFCQLLGCDGKLVVMGGWDPTTYDPVSGVFVYDFASRRWRRGRDMPSKRSFFAAGAFEGKVYVAGGHDENKNALRSAWAYDVGSDHWIELPPMSQDRDECEGLVIGADFWVVSGYSTENQGAFEGSAEVLDLKTGRWRRVDAAWQPGRCPRASVGVATDGKLVSLAESDPAVRVGTCGVTLGRYRTLITGSPSHGAPQGFYLVDVKDGQNGKIYPVSVPEEFLGSVQSGCCLEI